MRLRALVLISCAVWLAGSVSAHADPASDRKLLAAELARLSSTPIPSKPAIPDGRTLHPGDHNPSVPALRDALSAFGFAAPADPNTHDVVNPDPTLYDDGMAGQMRLFQASVGLVPDAMIGSMTRKALRFMDGDRVTMLTQTLGQPRLPSSGRYLVVNIAAGLVSAVEDGRTVLTSRVVVGKVEHQSPAFSAQVSAVWVNPLWVVPQSIATKEFGTDSHIEKPGPNNPLGQLLLEMPNRDEIFLHSTNEPHLFSRDTRPFSHGCIRVQEIEALVRWVLGEDRWEAEGVDKTLNGLKSKHIVLDKAIPIYLQYRTASVGPAGTILYHADPYSLAAAPPDFAATPPGAPQDSPAADQSVNQATVIAN